MSNRITKDMAFETAKKMTVKKQTALDKTKKELKKIMQTYAVSKIPKEIMVCFKKHKNVFNTQSCLRLVGNGFNHEWVDLEESLPLENTVFSPEGNLAKEIRTLLDSISTKDKELKELRKEIETALYNLRTYAKTQKDFPEAYGFLPSPNSETALTVNISAIRKKL